MIRLQASQFNLRPHARRGLALVGAGALLLAYWLMTPIASLAAEESSSRAIDRPDDWETSMMLVAGAALGILLLASLGYLYMRARGLEWAFQRPDPPAHDGHN